MAKKRIHELAKEYGLTGKELAQKLRDLGFSHVKSHMTALDEFQLLEVQGRLEAHGLVTGSRSDQAIATENLGGGLILRKKKKKKKAPEDAGVSTATEAPKESVATGPSAGEAEAAEAAAVPEVAAPEQSGEAVTAEPAAQETVNETDVAETAGSGTAAEAPAETPRVDEVPQAEPEVSEDSSAEKEAATAPAGTEPAESGTASDREASSGETAAAEPVTQGGLRDAAADAARVEERADPAPAEAVAETLAPAAELEDAPSGAVADAGETVEAEASAEQTLDAPKETSDEPVADAEATAKGNAKKSGKKGTKKDADKEDGKDAKKPGGKVVGFIDLSKIQTTAKKSESRRLHSRDDVTPNVQPTMRHDPRRALMRGDRGARETLSPSQLREREANRFRRHQGGRGGGRRGGGGRGPNTTGSPFADGIVKITEPITLKKLAEALAVKVNEIIMRAMRSGLGMMNINSLVDEDTATLLAEEWDVTLEVTQEVEAEEALIEDFKQKRSTIEDGSLDTRPPTVAVLGHVDHGKTTLIDSIRNTAVADGEAGGITQHIGAYQVTTSKGHKLTVIDTPGHAAFTSMRARGAKAVDVVILVVAADDGIKPQTTEAINHARAAGTPIVVALTKCDKNDANINKVMQELSSNDLLPEEFGGTTGVIQVAALQDGKGVDELLERVFLEGELLDLKAHADGPGTGVVLEAEVLQGKGIVAHLLVQDGTLEKGNVILAGSGYGKVRSLHDDRGKIIDSAEPSRPVEVTGLSALPGVGEPFHVVDNLAQAKEVAEERERKVRATQLAQRGSTAADAMAMLSGGTAAKHDNINVIVRADKEGSVEVLRTELTAMTHDEISVRVLQSGVGAVTESDVDLATASEALIVAFHVGVGDKARQAADRGNVEIRHFQVLYEVLDLLRERMEGSLAPAIQEELTGHTLIKRIFRSSKLGNIAGCQVQDGKIGRNDKARLLRDGTVVWTGAIGSLRRESDDAKEVREGFECGITLKGYNDVREGDIIESFKNIEVKRTLDDA